MDSGKVSDFYNQLAHDYHLIYPDWRGAVIRQGHLLDVLIQGQGQSPPALVLDCSCGIGTQAIGLALQGYSVHATDISATAVARARIEAQSFGVTLTFGVADVRDLATHVQGTYDVVLSCDNALPHLLTDEDMRAAVRNMALKLRPGGLLLASMRDYDTLGQEWPVTSPVNLFIGPDGKRVVFQVWEWASDRPTYEVHHFIVKERAERWETLHAATQYRAWRRDELSAIFHEAGLTAIRWHMPDSGAYLQPLVTAHKV